MSAGSAVAFRRVVVAGFATVFLFSLVAVSDVEAQGRRVGHVLRHDSSNPTPGHTKGRGKGHHKTPAFSMLSASGSIVSPTVQVAETRSVMGVRGMLRNQALVRSNGIPLSADVQNELHGLIEGQNDGATLFLLNALRGPDNDGAAAEAAHLVTLLAELPEEPETVPATALAYNDFIDESSDAFVLDPPEELLAIRAVLFTVLEPTLRAVEDEDDDEAQSQQDF